MRNSIAVVAMAMCGCAGGMRAVPFNLTSDHETAVKWAIKSQLKDPDSAQFGGMSAARIESTGLVRVCGTVNARNSFGGYGGHARFVADLDDRRGAPNIIPSVTDSTVGRPGNDIGLDVLCAQVGL